MRTSNAVTMKAPTQGDTEPVRSQGAAMGSSEVHSGSGPEADGSTVGSVECAVRASNSAVGGSRLVASAGVGETQILEEASFQERNVDVSSGEGGFLGDGKGTEGSSSSEDVRRVVIEHGPRNEIVRSLNNLFGEDENGDEKSGDDCYSTVLIGDGSDREVEFYGNGISLIVEVHGPLESGNMVDKKFEIEEDDNILDEDGADSDQKFTSPISLSKKRKKGDISEEGRGKLLVNDSGEETELGEEAAYVEDGGDLELEYSVGDFVWGKFRTHPWWPGRIYNASDASENALKHDQNVRFLVAFFGDGCFSWCSPFQLQPFSKNFEVMLKQSSSKVVVNAVQKALDEIGRLLELKMTCSCICEENQIGLARPLAAKGAVLMPDGGMDTISIPDLGPAELLAILRDTAQVISIKSMLELTVLKSWLSSFYRAKGRCHLAIYHDPLNIEGFEDTNETGVLDSIDLGDPVEAPVEDLVEEEWQGTDKGSVSMEGKRNSGNHLTSPLGKRQGWKKKVEILGSPAASENKIAIAGTGKSEGKAANKVSVSWEGKRDRGGDLISPMGRKRGRKKKAEILEFPTSDENNVASADHAEQSGENETDKMPKDGKKNSVSSAEGSDDKESKEKDRVSVSRERKKSKYLSPPFTNLQRRVRDSSLTKNSETKSVKIAKAARVGERVTEAAEQLISSPLIAKCSGVSFLEKDIDAGCDTAASSSPQRPKEEEIVIDSSKINAPMKGVLSEIRLAALSPQYLEERNSLDMIMGFSSTFKSAIFLNGSNYKIYHRGLPGRKRKSSGSELEFRKKKYSDSKSRSVGEERQSDQGVTKSKSVQAVNTRPGKSNMLKAKNPAQTLAVEACDEETSKSASLPVTLMVTFPPVFPLPSRDDLIAIFSMFGALNEMETDVLHDSHCARVVFLRASDAEQAFSISMKRSPFGSANVNYQLHDPSSNASKSSEVDMKTKTSSSPEGNETTLEKTLSPSESMADEVPRLLFIRQKLEVMTSMLERSGGEMSPEMKSNLEGEMKGLLEKVNRRLSLNGWWSV